MTATDKTAGRILRPPKAATLPHHQRMQKSSCGLSRASSRVSSLAAPSPALRVFEFKRKVNLMEHRGIRYTIHVGIARGQYRAVIHPDEVEMPSNKIFLSRKDAEDYAQLMIDRWLSKRKMVNERR